MFVFSSCARKQSVSIQCIYAVSVRPACRKNQRSVQSSGNTLQVVAMSFGFQLMRGVAWHYDGNRWTLCIVDVVARSQYNYTKKMSAVCHISQSLSPPQPAQAHLCTRLRGRRGKSLGGGDLAARRICLLYSALVHWSSCR